MPRSNGSKPQLVDYKNLQFVINNLENDQLSHMDGLGWDGEEILSRVQRMVEAGWKFSLKWDYYSGAIQATAVQMEKKRPNAGYGLSGRSPDVLDALQIVVYKHDVVSEGNLSTFEVDQSNLRG